MTSTDDLAALIRKSLPLARDLVNGDDAEARSELRASVGDEAFFEFSNIINALCSERARAEGSW